MRRRGSPWWESVLFGAGKDGTCWEWTACKNKYGYGKLHCRGKVRLTHRIVYEELRGPVPEGLDLDHLCRNRACCNPRHLEPVTRRENLLRGCAAEMVACRTNRCLRGHEFTEANTVRKSGRRTCRTCLNERQRMRYRARAAESIASGCGTGSAIVKL